MSDFELLGVIMITLFNDWLTTVSYLCPWFPLKTDHGQII